MNKADKDFILLSFDPRKNNIDEVAWYFNNSNFMTLKKSTFVQSKNTLNLSSCTSNC